MIDLALLLKPRLAAPDPRPMRQRLAGTLKQAVLDGTLKAASVLPASRVLAHELGCGRNTVLHAYEELAAEGYVIADRQGTVVSHLPTAAPAAGPRTAPPGLPEEGLEPGTRWDDVPLSWRCPDCGSGKEDFEMVEA